MLYETHQSDKARHMLEKIEKNIIKMTIYIKKILYYARKAHYDIRLIDLNGLVFEVSEFYSMGRPELSIQVELAQDLPKVRADEAQMEQVLLNLLVNAADAMPMGGTVIFRTAVVTDADMRGNIYVPKPGTYALLTVADTGVGMDEETRERIFEPFFTTKKTGRGTGLGLASAYGIVKGHGGYIDVDSKEGLGTTFSIYLPAERNSCANNHIV
jgi:signal transduction histidine kinase